MLCCVQTSEAERIGVDQVAKILPTGAASGATQRACVPCSRLRGRRPRVLPGALCLRPASSTRAACAPRLPSACGPPPSAYPLPSLARRPAVTAHMTTMHSAIKMLIARITLVHTLLLKMQSGGWVRGRGAC